MNKVYIPKAFDTVDLGYTILRDDLGSSPVTYPQLTMSIVVVDKDPYPLRPGQVLFSFLWQGSRDDPDTGWYAPRVQIDIREMNAALLAIGLAADMAKWMIKRFGFSDMHCHGDFYSHWNIPGGGDGSLFGLRPSPLMNVAFDILGIPRVVFDPRVHEYAYVHNMPSPAVDGWMDNRASYGPRDDGSRYHTIVDQVYGIDMYDAQQQLVKPMLELSEHRYNRWVAAGMPVISMTQHYGHNFTYYVPRPLDDWAIVQVVPDVTDPQMFVHEEPSEMYIDHYSKIRVV